MKNLKNSLLLTVAGLMACCSQAVAAPISSQAARQQAQAFLQERGRPIAMTTLRHASLKKQQAETQPYYVFNVGHGQGFVIVSGDDQTIPVLGYTDEGDFSEESIPENMQAWLGEYSRQIAYLWEEQAQGRQVGLAKALKKSSLSAIAPLLRCQWNQGAPYNNNCPMDGKERSVTGCVATAMAQVMYYHKYPARTTAVIPAYTTESKSLSVSSKPISNIDWNNMLPVYSGNETAVQKAAVAHLMELCGASVHMDYTSNSSGAVTEEVAGALKNYFGYDKALRDEVRNDYSEAAWINLIYEELANNGPVFYRGQSKGGGHAFVVDGYDGDGYFHLNWGWGGSLDGYFLLSVLSPGANGGIGASSSSDGYNFGQGAIMGAKPDAGGEEMVWMTTNDISAGNSSYSRSSTSTNFQNVKVVLEMYNMMGATYTFDFGVGLFDTDGNLLQAFDTGEYSSLDFLYGYSSYQATFSFGSGIANGTYHIAGISRLHGTGQWHKNAGSRQHHLIASVSGKTLTLKNPTVSLSGSITAVGTMEAGVPSQLSATITNNGDDFSEELFLLVDGTMNQGFAFEVESGTTVTKDLTFTPTSEGDIPVSICRRSYANGQYSYTPVVSGTVSVVAARTYDLSLSITVDGMDSDGCVFTPTLKTTIKVKNNGAYDYNNDLLVYLLREEYGGYSYYQDGKRISLNVAAGKEQTVQVEFIDVPSEYLYSISCSYYYTVGQMHYSSTDTFYYYEIDDAAITKGDANGDGRINGMDIVETVDCILNENYNQAADLYPVDNPDGVVNGMDLVELVDLVLSQDGSQNAPALRNGAGRNAVMALQKASIDGGLDFGVDSDEKFVMADLTVTLPEGEWLKDITTDAAHKVVWKQTGTNSYHVVCYSMGNKPFYDNEKILTFHTTGGEVRVADVLLSDTDKQEHWCNVASDATGIKHAGRSSVSNEHEMFDLQGRKICGNPATVKQGIYIKNHKKVTKK